MAIGEFEVDFLAAGSGEHAAVLQAHQEGAAGDKGAGDPEEQGQADAAGGLDDRAGRGKDTAADDSGDDKDVGAAPGEVPAQRSRLGQDGVFNMARGRDEIGIGVGG